MPQPTTIYVERIPEDYVPGKRLGRHARLDSRSALYPYRTDRPETALTDTLLTRHIPILDQGDVGSCEGNSEVGEQGTDPFYADIPAGVVLNEALALKLYSAAEDIDGDGPYPPNDNGTSNLSMAKAAKNAGFISGYQDAATVQDIAAALQTVPVRIGINWYSSFDEPASSGLIAISRNAYVRGGHALVLRGVRVTDRLFLGDNSWGESFGVKGSFEIGWDTLARLLGEQGEATVSVPLSQPAPVPVPDPGGLVPNAADLALWPQVRDWSHARHVSANRQAALAVDAWAEQLGLS